MKDGLLKVIVNDHHGGILIWEILKSCCETVPSNLLKIVILVCFDKMYVRCSKMYIVCNGGILIWEILKSCCETVPSNLLKIVILVCFDKMYVRCSKMYIICSEVNFITNITNSTRIHTFYFYNK